MDFLILAGGMFTSVALAAQLVSVLSVLLRFRKRRDFCATGNLPAVSILRPLCGVDNFIEETLETTFRLDYPKYEIVFCVADKYDPVIPIVEGLINAHGSVEAILQVGHSSLSVNPKLNNLIKGWHGSRYEWVIMADSNVLMPKNYVQCMLSAWHDDTGLVSSPPIGSRPQNLWAELECMFLNTYQARWQCFADNIGLAFAQGKSMLWRRSQLDAVGGIEALADDVAEDAAATRIVRGLGLNVRLVSSPFAQPLGYRSASEVWNRQLRWARLRRKTFPWFFVPEILVGSLPPVVMASVVAIAQGWPVVGTIASLLFIWYAIEAYLARYAGWHFSLRSIALCILRDALLPILWICAWAGDHFEWRGNLITIAPEAS